MSDLAMKVLKWQSTGDVGISSATLASIACGLKNNIYGHSFGAPHDAADFRRCVALIDKSRNQRFIRQGCKARSGIQRHPQRMGFPRCSVEV